MKLIKKEKTPLLAGIENQSSLDCLRKLLSKNADPNKKDKDGLTPLMRACESGDTDIVGILLEHNADTTEKTLKESRNCLHYAVSAGNIEIVTMIVKHKNGASLLNSVDSQKRTPLHYSEKYPDISNFLISNGADAAKTDIDGKKYNEVDGGEEEYEEEEEEEEKKGQNNNNKNNKNNNNNSDNNNKKQNSTGKGEEDSFVPQNMSEWLEHHNLTKYNVPFKRSKLQLHQLHTLTSKELSAMGIDPEGKNKILKIVSAIDPSEFSAPSHMRAILTVLFLVLALIPLLARFFQ